ncbi:MAG: hypothetical protein ACPGIJ_15320, partial [Mycobacterium sp.]
MEPSTREPAGEEQPADAGYGFPARLWRGLDKHPPPGVEQLQRWRSPLRGPWLTSVFGFVLLVTLPIDESQLVLGKYLAALSLILVAVTLTLSYPLTLATLGELDWGPV